MGFLVSWFDSFLFIFFLIFHFPFSWIDLSWVFVSRGLIMFLSLILSLSQAVFSSPSFFSVSFPEGSASVFAV